MDQLTLLLAAGTAFALGALGLAAAWRWPRAAVAAGYPLFLLGTTKYRDRGSAATLTGAVDLQVLFELGMSALLGAMVVAAVLSLRLSIRRPTLMEALLLAYGL